MMSTPNGSSADAEPRLPNSAVAVLTALLVFDVLLGLTIGEPVVAALAAGAVGLYAVANPRVGRGAVHSPAIRTFAAGAASLVATVIAFFVHQQSTPGPGQIVLGVVVITIAARRCSPRWSLLCVPLNAIALAATPFRISSWGSQVDGSVQLTVLILTVCSGAAAGIGFYLRDLDNRARVDADAARVAERTAMAADLHDFVAHHVTGILVQAQVAKMVAGADPRRLTQLLDDIEHSAGMALTSMRATVGALRNSADVEERGPVHNLTTLPDLLTGSASQYGPDIDLDVDDGLAGRIPYPVEAAIYRVVQEGLTNTRRHAKNATAVHVTVRLQGRRVVVSVADDATGSSLNPRTTGFGIIGLTERVTALGGAVDASATAQGFTLTASIPAT